MRAVDGFANVSMEVLKNINCSICATIQLHVLTGWLCRTQVGVRGSVAVPAGDESGCKSAGGNAAADVGHQRLIASHRSHNLIA